MPRIISIEPSQNPIKRLWKLFQSFESFTKVTIVTCLLLIIVTPYIVKNSQIFNPKAEEGEGNTAQGSDQPKFLSNQLLVKVKKEIKDKVKEGNPEDTGIPSLNAINKEHKVKSFERIAKKGADSDTSHDLFSWYLITLDAPSETLVGNLSHALRVIQTNPSNINANTNAQENRGILNPAQLTLQQLFANLKNDPNIEDIDLNYIVHTTVVPNDPYYSSTGSWGQTYPDLWGMKKINLEPAWDQATGSASIIVADIDTGVDRNHPDLAANMWTNQNEIPNNGIDDDNNGYKDDYYGWNFVNNTGDPMDDNGHGTHTAGTIGAIGNNGIGVVGVNWTSKIMALKFLNSGGSGSTSDGIKALQYAADMGARVSSNSWGCACPSQAMDDAVKYEHDKGMVMVAAAGNSNADAIGFSPADADYAVTVAASDSTDAKASFSNWGEKIDVAAPGVDILSVRASINPCTTMAGDKTVGINYCRASGTSMATPHVAGLAVLLLAKNPTLTNEEIRQIIRNGADDLGTAGKDKDYGYGRINTTGSMNLSATHPLTPVITAPRSRTVILGTNYQFYGSTPGPNFSSYKLEAGSGRSPTSWTTLTTSATQVPTDGLLATVDTTNISEEKNIFRLTATDTTGKSYQFQIHDVEVDNFDAEITLPALLVPKGTVDIIGSAQTKNGLGFSSYRLDWQQANAGNFNWWTVGISLVNNGTQPVVQGKLATWDTTSLNNGVTYSLRLTVLSNKSTKAQYIIPLRVDEDLVSGWPKALEAAYSPYWYFYDFITPAVADLDNDGVKEIVFLEPAGKITVQHKDGSSLPGFPVTLGEGYNFNFPVNIADLDGDGKKEIIASIASGIGRSDQAKIYIVKSDGSYFPGWPNPQFYSLSNFNDISPSVADLDLNGSKELVFADSNGNIHALETNGVELSGFPKKVLFGDHYGAVVSIADLDKDNKPEISVVSTSFSTDDNKIYLLDNKGNVLPGWPFTAPKISGYSVFFESAAASGDIDGDGQLELFAIGIYCQGSPTCSAAIYGWKKDGSILAGWPKIEGLLIGFSRLNSPAIGDIDNNGKDDVVVATYGIRAYDQNGLKFSTDYGNSAPALSDIDADDKLEISSAEDYVVTVIDDNGTTIWHKGVGVPPNFVSYHKFRSPAVIADLDNDGKSELILVDSLVGETSETNAYVYAYVWELPNPTLNPAKYDWPVFNHDPARTGKQMLDFVPPTPIPTLIPTSTPTPTPLPTPTPTPAPTSANAVYDVTLKAPKCAGFINSCDSTTLLNGRNGIGPESNAPNTINNSCSDGTSGTYHHSDESLDKLKVSTTDGSALASGKTVKIEATVWIWGATQDFLDLYYTSNANSPSWTFLTTLKASATGSQVLSTTYTLPSGSLQAIRGNFRYLGSASSCSTGVYDDHDDLIFETGSVSVSPTPTPTGVLPTSTPTPLPTSTPTPTPSDTIKPTVSITSPLTGSTVARRSTVTIAATASDNVSVTKVEFYVSGTLKCTDFSTAYSCSWKVPNAPNKTYSLQAKAYDPSNNIGSSAVVTVTSK